MAERFLHQWQCYKCKLEFKGPTRRVICEKCARKRDREAMYGSKEFREKMKEVRRSLKNA